MNDDKKKWEYKWVSCGPSASTQSQALLNQWGEKGWEIVAFQPTGERAYPGEGTFFLKRSL